jgi:3-phenylpropionate/cinnamic acid dioxygenase small subunit
VSAKTYAEVVEAVRALIAIYAHALDDGRTDDLVACFLRDGTCELPGMGTFEGHDALRGAFAEWKPRRPQRHLVVNTLLTNWSDDDAAAVSDVVFVLQGRTGWAIQLVGRYHDSFHCDDGAWRFSSRTAEFVPPPPGSSD